ncbi:uncharacterized protein MELLADRAFT_111368 [Melampsora larici-populina 98AG31]|uniref:Uncharacterized protein n=1 Tax=Melampsora larici-populina (strain 98AG31 / pathotype 3-4-7) TaxID=747676 RepID=F4S2Z4_MELLP|nr:uncharacterized protein MELLADRAFT_111368 [Melampsora larici-populina 98AG31]EGG00993.1 hypothetical protein MELLADRAFT_111368 [Melampsora larici-populina 98AG31]
MTSHEGSTTNDDSHEGRIAQSVKAQNRAVFAWLPPHHSAYCQAISEFTWYLLRVSDERFPPPPTNSELALLPMLSTAAILDNTAVFAVDLSPNNLPSTQVLSGRRKASWINHKGLFLYDLAQSGVPRATLEWIVSKDSRWNDIMLAFVAKHFTWALEQNAFSRYSINPTHITNEKLWGVLERWVRGRAQERDKMMRNPESDFQKLKVNNTRKKSLFEFRKQTISTYLGKDALAYLPSMDCCSDTEDVDGKLYRVNPIWRENLYSQWLHSVDELSIKHEKETRGLRSAVRRLDGRRQPARREDHQASIAPNLPAQCYHSTVVSNIPETERYLVISNDSSVENLESLLSRTKSQLR